MVRRRNNIKTISQLMVRKPNKQYHNISRTISGLKKYQNNILMIRKNKTYCPNHNWHEKGTLSKQCISDEERTKHIIQTISGLQRKHYQINTLMIRENTTYFPNHKWPEKGTLSKQYINDQREQNILHKAFMVRKKERY